MLPAKPGCVTTARSAAFKLVSWQSFPTARTILAPGASPCAICTSSEVSSHHPKAPQAWSGGALRSKAGHWSVGEPVHVGPHKTVTVVGAIPKVVSKVLRSF